MRTKITERGWAGHFCASRSCGFRRNTLIEYGDKRIIVSTVGNYQPYGKIDKNIQRENEIGYQRFYETMAFKAKKYRVYWDADVSKEVQFKSPWVVGILTEDSDIDANNMHEKVVKELAKTIKELK